MPSTEQIDGSPRTIPCANTYCTETAKRYSTCRKISKAAGPVPLFLIPQALSKEIRETDGAVLEILKKMESGRLPPAGEDEDVRISQVMIGKIKEMIHRVRIPYAGRINFSAAHNRRNPAMLLDLIKCHAALHFLQRGCDEDGSLIANHDDFIYARKLFISINNDVGGQETKLTRNEAAALDTIRKLGLNIFTLRQLQETIGLSYHQTYRLMHGYFNSRSTYQGILDKCPAVSLIDATVVEELCGVEARRREQYFSFDHIHYKTWSARAEVWLEEESEEEKTMIITTMMIWMVEVLIALLHLLCTKIRLMVQNKSKAKMPDLFTMG